MENHDFGHKPIVTALSEIGLQIENIEMKGKRTVITVSKSAEYKKTPKKNIKKTKCK